MNVINFFAGPGAGKSTMAAALFVEMKNRGEKVELVTEYAKDMVYENRSNILDDQLYVLAKQSRRLSRLKGVVDWVVTDSPLLLTLVYNQSSGLIDQLAVKLFREYDNCNFFLERVKPYMKYGRGQTEDEAREIDREVRGVLSATRTPHTNIPGELESLGKIITQLGLE